MKDNLALFVAVIALVALGAGGSYLASQIAASDLHWARLQYLFGAIEAVAFAAAGWLWGKEVHREPASKAFAALEAKGEATGKLKTLADAVVANVGAINQVHDDIGGGHDALAAAHVKAARSSLDALLALARKYQSP